MSMWNTKNEAALSRGVDDRVPGVKARYYFPKAPVGNSNPSHSGRGDIATIRLLNASPTSTGNAVQDRILKELAATGSNGKNPGNGVTSFLLQSVSYQDSEKSMVMQTFGDDSAVYFLGRSPRMMSFNGILLDDAVNNWFYKFMVAYDKFLRGTMIARKFRSISVTMHNCIVTGTIMDMSYSQEASTDNAISFSFSMLVKQYVPISAYRGGSAYSDRVKAASGTNIDQKLSELLERDIATLTPKDIQRISDRANLTLVRNDGYEDILDTINQSTALNAARGPSNVDLIGQLIVGNNEFGTFVLPYVSKRAIAIGALGDPVIVSNTSMSAPGTYDKIKQSYKNINSEVEEFLYGMERGIRSIDSWFTSTTSAVSGGIKTFLDPVTKVVKAGSRALTSVKTLVSSVQTSVDKIFEPLVRLSQDYNEMRRNLDNTVGLVVNLPDTVSSKISNNIRLVRYGGMASLGSISGGVTSAEAAAVLARLQPNSVEAMGIISIQRAVNTESRVLAL